MTDEQAHRENILERLTRLEGSVSALLLQLEAGDNSIRQLLRFDQDRFERIDRELDDLRTNFTSHTDGSVSPRAFDEVDRRLGAVEASVRTMETSLAQGEGRGETWKSILIVVAPATLAFLSSLIVAYVAWRLAGISPGL